MRAITSAKLIPQAATSMRTQPGSNSGSGRSTTLKTSGPPCLVISTVRIAVSLPGRELGRSAEHDSPAGDKALGGDDLIDNGSRHWHVGGHDHRGQALIRCRLCPEWGIGRMAYGSRGDVDAVRTEDVADAPDHARQVGVAEDRDEGRQLDRQTTALHLDEVGN